MGGVTAFGSPGRFESEKAVLQVTGGSLAPLLACQIETISLSSLCARVRKSRHDIGEQQHLGRLVMCISGVCEPLSQFLAALHPTQQASACGSLTMEPITLSPRGVDTHSRFAVGVSTRSSRELMPYFSACNSTVFQTTHPSIECAKLELLHSEKKTIKCAQGQKRKALEPDASSADSIRDMHDAYS